MLFLSSIGRECFDRRGFRRSAWAARVLAGLLVVAGFAGLRADEVFDGPYVMRTAAGGWESWTVVSTPAGKVKKAVPVAVGDKIEVAAVGSCPAFTVRLRAPEATPAPDEATLPKRVPLFVMADSHGQYEIAAQLLRKHGVIDDRLHWNFGRGRLVLTGDVFDRGPRHTEIFWLIYQLEAEAAAAGGRVYFILGNHEQMEMLGDLRYTHERYTEAAKVLGQPSYAALWGRPTLLGQWLRSKPVVFKLDRTIFLHGGLSAETAKEGWTLAEMNRVARAALKGELHAPDAKAEYDLGPMGPLWYRGYFPDIPRLAQAKPEEVEQVCAFYGVDRIVVGHTIIPHVITYFQGRVVAVDVNMELDDKGQPLAEGVLVQGGHWIRCLVDGSREPLAGARDGL